MAKGWVGLASASAAALLLGTLEAGAEPADETQLWAGMDEVCELSRVDRARTSSEACIACHDGAAGAGIMFQMRPGEHGMSHPVEVDYADAAFRYPGRYVPEGGIPADVPLVHGRVACTSCHDGASPDPKRVVDPARLCQACHVM